MYGEVGYDDDVRVLDTAVAKVLSIAPSSGLEPEIKKYNFYSYLFERSEGTMKS